MRSARLPTASPISLAPSFSPQPHSPSSCRLQTPAMTEVDADSQHTRALVRFRAWLPHDRNWLAAITQFPGTIFFNISTLRCALAQRSWSSRRTAESERPDFFGSTLFLWRVSSPSSHWDVCSSFRHAFLPLVDCLVEHDRIDLLHGLRALLALCCPSSGELINNPVSVGGTLLGAVCFLLGAILMFPEWRRAVRAATRPLDPGRSTNSKEKPTTATPEPNS